MVLPPLTENERIVKDAIRDIVIQGGCTRRKMALQ